MNVLLLGGTGAMGTHLASILNSQNHQVYVTSRTSRKSYENVSFIKGNAHDNSFLNSLLNKKWDCIVDFMVYNTSEFQARVESILDATKQYVFLSSSRVYADSDTPITEKSPRLLDVCEDKDYLATDEYALTKARQENILFKNLRKNWTIIRPYITYSEQRLQLGVMEKEEWLYLALCSNALVFSKDIASKKTTLTYGFDVARGIASIIGQEKAYGQAFHITGSKNLTWQKVFEIYQEVLNKNGFVSKVYMPNVCYRIENNAAKYQVMYDRYFNRCFDNSKISEFVDISTFKDVEVGLKECLEYFLKNKEEIKCSLNIGFIKAIRDYGISIPLKSILGYKHKIKYILTKMKLYK